MSSAVNKLYILLTIAICLSCEPKLSTQSSTMDFEKLSTMGNAVRLSPDIMETSGLSLDNGMLWTHNDNGNKAFLFQFDKDSGKILRSVKIDEIKNNDWEEIEMDSTHVYIGDIGNNAGDRKNLRICMLEKQLLYETDVVEIEPQKIRFHFPGQPDKLKNNGHDYDVEAFLVLEDSVYIFTKNWLSNTCNLYAVPKKEGTWDARFISSFDTQGLITSATVNETFSKIILLGYNRGKPQRPFIWILEGFSKDDFFNGSKKRYNLNFFAQTEAIAIVDDHLVVTSEGNKTTPPKLYRLPIPD